MTSTEIVVEPPMPQVLRNARGLHLILELAEMRGLPMPFAGQAYDHHDYVELQFRSRDEVVTWAELLEVDVEDLRHVHAGGVSDHASALGEWLEVPLRVTCSVLRERVSA